jgi:hypothetical protein
MSDRTKDATKVKFKSTGKFQGAREVAVFKGGGWKAWLEFLREFDQLYDFLGLKDSAEGTQEVLSQLIFDSDLSEFQASVAGAMGQGATLVQAILEAIRQLTAKHCPPGTRQELHEEVKRLRKKKGQTVEEHVSLFRHLLKLENWLPREGGDPMSLVAWWSSYGCFI